MEKFFVNFGEKEGCGYVRDCVGNRNCRPIAWRGSRLGIMGLKSHGSCSACRVQGRIESEEGRGVP